MEIVALDLGKSRMVGCIYDTRTHEHRFDRAPLARGTLRTVLESERPDRVVIEIGSSAGWVGDVVRARASSWKWPTPAMRPGLAWPDGRMNRERITCVRFVRFASCGR